MEELLEILGGDPWERLRWMVMREFGVLPGSREERALSNVELLRCGAHMVLDVRAFARDGDSAEASSNPAFDSHRFAGLKETLR